MRVESPDVWTAKYSFFCCLFLNSKLNKDYKASSFKKPTAVSKTHFTGRQAHVVQDERITIWNLLKLFGLHRKSEHVLPKEKDPVSGFQPVNYAIAATSVRHSAFRTPKVGPI